MSASGHQLKIVDHNNSKVVLQLIFPALGPELGNGNTRRIVNDQVGTADNIGALHQLGPVLILQITGSHVLGIHMGLHGKETVYKLLLGHLKTEYGNGNILAKCHILGNVQNKRCFSHGRTGCDQNQVRGMHSGGLVIQIHKSGRNTSYGPLQLGCLFNVVNCI